MVSGAWPEFNAEIWVSGVKVNDGIENAGNGRSGKAWKTRGHHVAVINEYTGEVIDVKCFDTHNDKHAGIAMRDFLGKAADGRIIAFAICDSGDAHVEASMEILGGLGCESQPGLRTSQACVGQKGCVKADWWRFAEGTFTGEGKERHGTTVTVETEVPVKDGGEGKGDDRDGKGCYNTYQWAVLNESMRRLKQ